MRILIVGSGGREHALAWKLAQEAEVICAPGNPGIALVGECVPVAATDHNGLTALALAREVDLVLVGPENPLVAGLADKLRGAGIATLGPGADGAQLEASKAYSKALMVEAGVPTPRFETFFDPLSAKAFAGSLLMQGKGVVVKASGNALGKGVMVCSEPEEVAEAIDAMLVDREFGDAGAEIVIEERLIGYEFSLLTLCSGTDFRSLPVAQDYKRALDGDRGPNTGGMGSYSPVGTVDAGMVARVEASTVKPILDAMRSRGIDYRGVLFSGMMVEEGVAYCLEYNVRFGDPETQSVVRRLGNGFAVALGACANGAEIPSIEVLDDAAVTVVVASGGYPGTYAKGKQIELGPMPGGVEVFHSGTSVADGKLVTAGGRVCAVSAAGATQDEARKNAYQGAEQVKFEGAFFRRDIAS